MRIGEIFKSKKNVAISLDLNKNEAEVLADVLIRVLPNNVTRSMQSRFSFLTSIKKELDSFKTKEEDISGSIYVHENSIRYCKDETVQHSLLIAAGHSFCWKCGSKLSR